MSVRIEPEILRQDIGGIEIQYLHYPSEGPALVLLHATGFLPWLWHPIAQALWPRFRIIAPYFCDHRSAEPEEGGLSWKLLASDLAALCRGLGLERPYMAGHSMGATVTAIASATEGLAAEKMVLIEPIFLPEAIYRTGLAVEQHPLASRSIKRRNGWDSEADARSYLSSKKMFEKWDAGMMDLYVKYGMISGDGGGLVLACHPRREAALFMGGLQFDPWPVLASITCPVMIVEGEASENRSYIDLPKVASLLPNGSHRLIQTAGHLIPQERPVEITDLLSEFFGS